MKAIRAIISISAIAFVFAFALAVPASAHDNTSCPLSSQPGRTIIDLNEFLRSDQSEASATGGPINATLSAGTYDVTLVSFDDHTNKGGQSQDEEQWFLILADLSNSEITRTSAIADLADSQDFITQVVDTDFVVPSDVSLVTAFHNAYPTDGANSIEAVCAAFDLIEEEEEDLGSIRVCKAIIDEEGNIVDGSDNDGTFTVSWDGDILPATEFQTPLTLNADVFENIPGNDAQCVLHEDLEIQNYGYNEEEISGNDWTTPLYNDQFSDDVEDTDDFRVYNSSGDSNADGSITLTDNRRNRELIILNQYGVEEPTGCQLELTKEANKESVDLGEQITYTLTLENTGDANCTGGGVELQDFLPFGTTYVSHELTPSDHDTESASIIEPDYVEVNLGTMPPDDFVILEITVELNENAECGYPLTNEARYWSNETGNSDLVKVHTDVSCEPHNPEPTQCLIYGVHDESGSDSQFLTLNADTALVATIGNLHDNKDIEGLDAHPTTGVLYASSGSNGDIYTVEADTGELTLIGNSGFGAVESLSFKDTDGTLWGWADDEGLLEINIATGVGAPVLDSETKVEGLAWNNEGTLLYAAGDSDLYVYDPSGPSFTQIASNLPDEVEALEIVPSGMLLGGNHNGNELFFYDIDEEEVISSSYNTGDFDDIEGLAWPVNCGDFPPSENTPPEITLIGDDPVNVPVGTSYDDDGATADDTEDGDITGDIVTAGDTVDPNTLGTYVITYNVTDSDGASAPQITRTVNVTETTPQCSDGEDNEADSFSDSADPTCHTDGDPDNPDSYDPNIDDENSPPEITVLGDNPLEVLLASTFTDPGATAFDQEDGDITGDIIINGDVVNTNSEDSYDVIYRITDSGGLTDEETRVVNVVPFDPPQCSDGVDNDGDSLIDITDNGCHTDGDENNPDSYDPNIDDENTPPEITLIEADITVIQGNPFTDPGATAFDVEDVDLTADIVVGGDTVDIDTLGDYIITYDVTDSDGASAPQVTRTVHVVPGGGGGPIPECSDSLDNDGDQTPDSNDPGCHTDGDPDNPDSYDPNDDDENSAPEIVLIDSDISLTIGDSFTDPGATASDDEDGDITGDIVTAGDTVDPDTIGSYVITYDVTDSNGTSAPQVTRTVTVGPGGGGGCVTNCGGGLPNLEIKNETVTVPASGVAVVTWTTNIPATSQVVYDDDSHETPTVEPDYGYESLTTETIGITTTHRTEITGLIPGTEYFFRPVSKAPNVPRGIGDEVTFTLGGPPIIPPGGPTQCTYLEDYLRIDFNNDPEEVRKLQVFLRDFEGFTGLEVTQVFDQATFAAVSAFQERYRSEVLTPWGLPNTTGYVYYTTQKKVNEIFCSQAFPLSQAQVTEIDGFRALLESLQTQPGGITPEIEQEIEDLEGQVGVAPITPGTGGGGTLAVTTPIPGTTGPEGNVLETGDVAGALGIIPEGEQSIQEGTQVATLIGTVGTSGALAIFDNTDLGEEEAGIESSQIGLMATVLGNLTPSTGRGITIAGIVILLAYLALARVGQGARIATSEESIPDIREEGEGTILEV